MSRARRKWLLWGLVVGSLAASPGTAGDIDVLIRSPAGDRPVFGRVTFEVDVLASGSLAHVDFFVDGRPLGRFTEAPYRVTVDLGQDNREHLFEVFAVDADGDRAHRSLRTPAVRVDEEIDLSLRQLYVTVTRDGARVLDVSRDAFSVFEDGVRQDLVTFERGDVPLTALLVVDASESMTGGPLAAALAGARAFARTMTDLDQASLLLFSDRVLYRTPFTNFPEILSAGLSEVAAAGGTAVHDHLYLGLKLLEEPRGRRVLILLTDGRDVASVLSMEDLLPSVRRSEALIYWLRLGDPLAGADTGSAWRAPEETRRQLELLEEAVSTSGGRILTLARVEEADEAFREILGEMREQYVLGYYPSDPGPPGSWRRIRVRVDEPRLEVRTREGYFEAVTVDPEPRVQR